MPGGKKMSSVFKNACVVGLFYKFRYVKEIIWPTCKAVSASKLQVIFPSLQFPTVKLGGKIYVDVFGYIKLSQASQRANKDNLREVF